MNFLKKIFGITNNDKSEPKVPEDNTSVIKPEPKATVNTPKVVESEPKATASTSKIVKPDPKAAIAKPERKLQDLFMIDLSKAKAGQYKLSLKEFELFDSLEVIDFPWSETPNERNLIFKGQYSKSQLGKVAYMVNSLVSFYGKDTHGNSTFNDDDKYYLMPNLVDNDWWIGRAWDTKQASQKNLPVPRISKYGKEISLSLHGVVGYIDKPEAVVTPPKEKQKLQDLFVTDMTTIAGGIHKLSIKELGLFDSVEVIDLGLVWIDYPDDRNIIFQGQYSTQQVEKVAHVVNSLAHLYGKDVQGNSTFNDDDKYYLTGKGNGIYRDWWIGRQWDAEQAAQMNLPVPMLSREGHEIKLFLGGIKKKSS